MQALLNASEEIRICPETRFMDKVMKPYYRYPAGVGKSKSSRILRKYVTAHAFADSGINPENYLARMREISLHDTHGLAVLLTEFSKKHQATRVGEKTPGHLYIAHRLLQEFPKSAVVAMVRDPRAVYASIRKTNFNPYGLSLFIPRWKMDFYLVQALKQLHPTRVLPVYYEDLVESPVVTMRKVTDFIGITFSDEMLRPAARHLEGIDFQREPWKANVANPITSDSKSRWKNELSPAQVSRIEYWCHAEISASRGALRETPPTSPKDSWFLLTAVLSAALELKWKLSRCPWKREVVAMLVAESAARSGEANHCIGR